MKKEIKFPKGATNINFDLVNGVAIATYEEEKPVLKAGEWYKNVYFDIYSLYDPNRGVKVGFTDGRWSTSTTAMYISTEWKPANMEEVEKLLITKATNDYPIGTWYNGVTEVASGESTINSRFKARVDSYGYLIITDGWGGAVFTSKSGKWAEIIPKETELERLTKIAHEKGLKEGVEYLSPLNRIKRTIRESFHLDVYGDLVDSKGYIVYRKEDDRWAKPILFTNSKETHFCEGDKCFYVEKESFQIIEGSVSDGGFGEDSTFTEIMTKKQCYQWLADNCKE